MMSELYFWVCTRCGEKTVSPHRPTPGKCPGSPDEQAKRFQRSMENFVQNKKSRRRAALPAHRWVKDGIVTEYEYKQFLQEKHEREVRGRIGCFLIILLIIAFIVVKNYISF